MSSSSSNQQQDKQRRNALHMIEQYKSQVLRNQFEFNGQTYPLLVVDDLIEKENYAQCPYCVLHAPHTPCGPQLQAYKDCLNQKTDKKTPSEALASSTPNQTEDNEMDNDPCSPIFKDKFYPCLLDMSSHPYMYLRISTMFGINTKDLFKVWFQMQKFRQLSPFIRSDSNLRRTTAPQQPPQTQ